MNAIKTYNIRDNKQRVRKTQHWHGTFCLPETMAKHVHYLQQRLHTQLPRKVIKLSEKRHTD